MWCLGLGGFIASVFVGRVEGCCGMFKKCILRYGF